MAYPSHPGPTLIHAAADQPVPSAMRNVAARVDIASKRDILNNAVRYCGMTAACGIRVATQTGTDHLPRRPEEIAMMCK